MKNTNFKTNRVMLADSYKYTQPKQYPKNTTFIQSFMEARSSKVFKKSVFFGLQMALMEYFSEPITKEEVAEANDYADRHLGPGIFDREGWDYIVEELDGNIPVKIRAIPEGTVVPNGNVVLTIESTDEKVAWIVGWMETFLMKIWYPTTVATKSYYAREMIMKHLKKSGSPDVIGFKYHNFGDRAATGVEAAVIGGMAHSVIFDGTDNFQSLKAAAFYYDAETSGYSIPASEHSTVTSWGVEGRFDMYDSHLENFKDSPVIACVMDSYDIYKDVAYVTSGAFKEKVESDGYPVFVIRPDSGDPIEVLSGILDVMEKNAVSFFVNKKGYMVFKKYALIWGDGVSLEVIDQILDFIESRGYSADIIAFGSGGDLMQKVNRDTMGFAVKASVIIADGKTVEIFKDPITDPGKKSRKGYQDLEYSINGFKTVSGDLAKTPSSFSAFKTVFENGELKIRYSFEKIRNLTYYN